MNPRSWQPRDRHGSRTRRSVTYAPFWNPTGIDVRFRGQFAYIAGKLPDGSELPLCRLRYGGYASTRGFAIYRASHDDYQDSYLPSGQPAGTPEEALDCACGLYLGDPTAWLTPPAPIHPRIYRQEH